jgi:hypothetical protein
MNAEEFRKKYSLGEGENSLKIRSKSIEVKLFAEGEDKSKKSWIEMVRKGEYYYYGEVISIGNSEFSNAIANFEKGVANDGVKKDMLIDYDHDYRNSKAAGWCEQLKVSEDGETLLGLVDWSKCGSESIEGNEYRYTSIEFSPAFYTRKMIDEDTMLEEDHGFTLFACTLTNRPFVKGMEKVTLSENKPIARNKKIDNNVNTNIGGNDMEFKEKFEAMEAKFNEVSTELEGTKIELAEKISKVKELEGEISFGKKDAEFDKMMQENKVVEAQRIHFHSGDMVEFAKAFSNLPVKEGGTSEEEQVKEVTAETITARAEEISKEQNITFSEAIKAARKELIKE